MMTPLNQFTRRTLLASGSAALASSLVAGQQAKAATQVLASAIAASPQDAIDQTVKYRTVTVEALEIFYREAGSPEAPTLLLLHGFPTSSHMFRNLIPALASQFHAGQSAPNAAGLGQK